MAFKVTSEGSTSLDNPVHDLVALLVCNARSKRVVSEVATDANTSGLDEGGTFFRERWAVQLLCIHIRHVLVSWLVAVIVLNHFVEESAEGLVRISRASIAAYARVNVLAAGEYASLERDADSVRFVVVLTPNVLGEEPADRRLAVGRELGESDQLFRSFQVRATLCTSGAS